MNKSGLNIREKKNTCERHEFKRLNIWSELTNERNRTKKKTLFLKQKEQKILPLKFLKRTKKRREEKRRKFRGGMKIVCH